MRAGLVAVVAVAFVAPAAAQEASAELRLIEAAAVDAASDEQQAEVCLDGGQYVLAFRLRMPVSSGSGRARFVASTPLNTVDQQLTEEQVEFWNNRLRTFADISVAATDERRWTWQSFFVADPECFRVEVTNGRARLYAVRVGVDW